MPAPFRAARAALAGAAALLLAVPALTAQTPAPASTEVRYVRDAAEYAALTRQVYREALAAVNDADRARMRGPW
ncbi:MAG TPA: hypothetical protein VFI13_13090, partial [Gemmatimonadales bacterium]|nr:hypothetical protein [Gemmatimonadales bacterium]